MESLRGATLITGGSLHPPSGRHHEGLTKRVTDGSGGTRSEWQLSVMDARLLLWAARITGTLLLGFLLFMLIGHLTGDANGPTGMRFSNNRELIAFLFFPVCTIIGLAFAYKWELLGGAIAIGSLLALFLLRPDLMQVRFLLMLLPGVLYLLHGKVSRRGKLA